MGLALAYVQQSQDPGLSNSLPMLAPASPTSLESPAAPAVLTAPVTPRTTYWNVVDWFERGPAFTAVAAAAVFALSVVEYNMLEVLGVCLSHVSRREGVASACIAVLAIGCS